MDDKLVPVVPSTGRMLQLTPIPSARTREREPAPLCTKGLNRIPRAGSGKAGEECRPSRRGCSIPH